MRRMMLSSAVFMLAFACLAPPTWSAGKTAWTVIKTGPFVVYSETGAKDARECAAEMEQFRFSLGELLGRRDLTIQPALELFLFRGEPESAPGFTRLGAVAVTQAAGPLTRENRRALARNLLEQNVGRMPPALERGLETFLSTTELHGARVVWGAPPPVSERDSEWALLEWLVTNPETYGNVRVLLANLESGLDPKVAYDNSIHRTPEAAQAAADAHARAGQFQTIDGPSRPLSPERDLSPHPEPDGDIELRLADLLNAQSRSRYLAMLNGGVNTVQANEGLGILAARAGDQDAAREYLRKAIDEGSHNAIAVIEYARVEPDRAKSRDALKAAVDAGNAPAEAHYLYADRLPSSPQRIAQFRAASGLAPRVQRYWEALAHELELERQWPEAVKAWRGAEQAAETSDERERMIQARLAIETKRLDFEEAERKRAEEKREAEINRLKKQAIAEIRAAEAKVNSSQPAGDTANAIPWDQLEGQGARVEGELVRIDCVARAMKLILRLKDGSTMKLDADPSSLTVASGEGATLTCGPQKQRQVAVTYAPKPNARTGVAGRATSIDFR